jgi:hypothetical protein
MTRTTAASNRPSTTRTTLILHHVVLVALSSIILIVAPSSCTAAASASSTSSFYRDVLNPAQTRASLQQNEVQIQSALLEKAMLRSDFEAKYGVSLDGVATVNMNTPPAAGTTHKHRKLEESEDSEDEDAQDDDYYMNYNYMYSFSGYSLKFAKCQPVQYFSEYALAAGEHSPMVTDDIVILRLCPTSSCKSSSSDSGSTSSNTYGCQYNFSEYAIELSEYVRIMLRYSAQKRDYMCTYCASCLNGGNGSNNNANGRHRTRRTTARRLEDESGDEQENDVDEEDQQQAQQANNNNGADDYYRVDDDTAAAADDYAAAAASDTDDYYKNACSTWSTYCSDYGDLCFLDDEDNNQYYSYLDYEDYLDYLDCAQVKYNDYAYFVRPRCDGYQGTIKMAVYYDNYCVQYAGNEVSLKNLGLGFRESAFADFYSGQCLDCSESVSFLCVYSCFLFFLLLSFGSSCHHRLSSSCSHLLVAVLSKFSIINRNTHHMTPVAHYAIDSITTVPSVPIVWNTTCLVEPNHHNRIKRNARILKHSDSVPIMNWDNYPLAIKMDHL